MVPARIWQWGYLLAQFSAWGHLFACMGAKHKINSGDDIPVTSLDKKINRFQQFCGAEEECGTGVEIFRRSGSTIKR